MIKRYIVRIVYVALLLLGFATETEAQELNARVKINHNQIQGTDNSVFEELEQTLTQFINERQWTNLQFQKNERITCNFNITVTAYDNSTNVFTCKAVIQANRPVYNSTYTTTLYNNTDNDFNFEYAQFDQLQFNDRWTTSSRRSSPTTLTSSSAWISIRSRRWVARTYCSAA